MTGRRGDRATAVVLRAVSVWDGLLLAGLPAAVALPHAAELAADVADHARWGRERGRSGPVLALRIGSRVLRGVPADLAWRRDAQRRLGRRHRGVPHWSSEPVFLVLLALLAALGVGVLALLTDGALPPLVGALASLALADRWLRRRDAAGYWDDPWQRARPIPGLRTDFRETGSEQRPRRR